MKRERIVKNTPLLLVIALNILLFSAVLFLMNYVQNLLNTDVKINLSEVVTQNKDVISSKFRLEINNVLMIANQIENRLKRDEQASDKRLKTVFGEYVRETGDNKSYIALKDGTAIFHDGTTLSVSGRKYFRFAIQGIQNISERIVSRLNGEEIFVISVPLLYRGEIAGTVQRPYSPDEMYDICSLSLFSSQGTMNIINNEGYILVGSRQDSYNRESENYFRQLYAQGNQEASKQIEQDVKNNRSGFMETIEGGRKIFSAYTPIEEIHDWYLISSVATEAVSANATTVIKIFYCVLIVVVLIFILCISYFFSYKNRQQANLEQIAFVDSVTGGNTLTKFALDLRKSLENYPDKQFCIFKFDIDNFKYVNNFYGFDRGDQILRNIYQTLSIQLLPHESIARISGDHFVLLLENISMERLEQMHVSIQENRDITLYFSAGLYKITNPEESLNLMLDKAAAAAQVIKGNLHKNVEIYTEKFDQQMIHNEQMKRAIKQALSDKEIIPFFQPKVDVFTGKLAGAEALARWRSKDGKLIPPGEFIPICEKTGLIVELDMTIFEQTLQFLQRNLAQGYECVPISVNFSRLHLSTKDFIDTLMDKMNQYQVPPHLIEIELTETVIFDNHEIITDFIRLLHQNGLLISMDDFGSGYSSLNMLKDIPIDVLKIDRGFLMETDDIEKRDIILSSITQMASRLHIKVVVEGVETKENVDLMKEFGCSIAQGYYFAKPMDEQSFEKIYKEGSLCKTT